MARISTYPMDAIPTVADYVIGTDADDLDITKNYRIGDIIGLGGGGTVTSITPAASTGVGTAITTIGIITFTGAGGITTSINAANEITITGSGGSGVWTTNGSDIYNNNAGNVGIGSASVPSAPLEVTGRISQIGLNNSTFIGFESGANDTGGYNTAVGYQALKANIGGSSNVAIGYNSLLLNTSGGNNSSIGYNSLQNNTIGSNNLAIGTQSLQANISGSQNVAIGSGSLGVNTIGGGNTASGTQALSQNLSGNNNSAVGFASLISNTIADNNSAVGYSSLQSNTSGANNSVIGSYALSSSTTGSSNIAVGSDAGRYEKVSGAAVNTLSTQSVFLGADTLSNTSGETNQIVIGYGAIAGGSNTVSIGNSNIVSTFLKGDVSTIGNISGKIVKTLGYTYADLLVAVPVPAAGMRSYITDAPVVLAWRDVASGGSTVVAAVFYDGTNWIYS